MKKTCIRTIAFCLIMLLSCAMLTACGAPNSNPSAAKDALEKNNYTTVKIDSDGLSALLLVALKAAGVDDVETVVTGTNKDGEHVTIVYFDTAEDAKRELDDMKDYAEDQKEYKSDWVIKQSGNMVYFGTKAAVKAAK